MEREVKVEVEEKLKERGWKNEERSGEGSKEVEENLKERRWKMSRAVEREVKEEVEEI